MKKIVYTVYSVFVGMKANSNCNKQRPTIVSNAINHHRYTSQVVVISILLLAKGVHVCDTLKKTHELSHMNKCVAEDADRAIQTPS